MLKPLNWRGARTPAGYQEAETVNQLLTAAQKINEAPPKGLWAAKTHHSTTFLIVHI